MEMNRLSKLPRITFGIIVLNGEPFIRYNIRSLYPFAHEIIVVEGADEKASDVATSDGHSVDGTLEVLHCFKTEEDSENKLTIVTAEDHGYPNGFWPGGKDQQSQAYADRATGDYIWQVDIDEFYDPEDMHTILRMLASNPSIMGISFNLKDFWGGFEYLVDGWEYRNFIRAMNGIRRIFRWGKGHRYIKHRPPTVVNEQGKDLCGLNWIGPSETAKMGLFIYHYGMVFPKQARQKSVYYKNIWKGSIDMSVWYRDNYLKLSHPFTILHSTEPPSWLYRFSSFHPPEIRRLIEDCHQGKVTAEQRPINDIERLLKSHSYYVTTVFLSLLYYVVVSGKRLTHRAYTACKKLFPFRPWRYPLKIFRKMFSRSSITPLEALPNVPDLFQAYRVLCQHPELERKPGGWVYKGKFYADYLTVGGASHAIFREALKFCQGRGIDIGASLWPLPGAIPVDIWRGPGVGRTASDFEENSLDFVFSSHCLEHIENWQKALEEWVSKLKLSGVVFLYLPHPECALWHPDSPFIGDGHKWIPTPEIVKQALQRLGCEISQFDDGPDEMESFYICGRKQGRVSP